MRQRETSISLLGLMKTLALIVVSLLLPGFVHGVSPPPAWHRIDGKAIGFFKDKGFEFSVDDSMAHHYEKPTVEIAVSIPDRFTDAGLTNEFDLVIILSKDISTALGTRPHSGKKRIILTISETMIKKSQLVFYFKNVAKDAPHGSMYILDLAKVMNDWRKSKDAKPNNALGR